MMTQYKWFASGAAILIGLTLLSQISVGQVSIGDISFGKIGVGQNSRAPKLTDAQYVEYEKQLNAILKTRLDEEKEFVHEVIEKLKADKLPAKLVISSWQWARNHRPDTKYPFVYFEQVLRLQATRIGLQDEVPPYDYGIYSKTNRPRKR